MDFMQKAIQEIQNKYNISVESIIFDGKIKRFGEKQHAWYVGHEFTFKGQLSQSVTYGSWRDGSQITINSLNWEDRNDKNYIKAYNKHTLETKVQLESEKVERQKTCKEKYWPIWKAAKTSDHDYLKYKNIDAFISRVDMSGERLLIPVYDVDGFVGVQKIFKIDDKFEKKFSFGIKISASFCPLASFKNSEYIYVSEGFATAASIQMAFPDIPSICVFSANNISKAISSIRAINPKCKIIIAADKDKNKAGEKGANEAMRVHANIVIMLPVFSIENEAWTDFNDLHSFESLNAVKEQLKIQEHLFTKITKLGYSGSDYYYTSTSNNQIIELAASAHNMTSFFQLAPEEFWKKTYAITDSEGKESISYASVASELMKECREAGLFVPDNVRGRGVWKDGNQYVINNGERVIPEPVDSRFHYQKGVKHNLNITTPFSDDEMLEFTKLFTNIRFKNKKDYIYLMAWIVQSQIFSVLDWRFHLWLTGGKGTGKSTILKWMHKLTQNGLLSNNTTVSGIRQQLGNDARVSIIDESEPSSKRCEAIIELARAASTNGDFGTYRGTSGGTGIVSNTQTCFLFGSIQVNELNAADKSRIFIVEMDESKDQTVEEYREMEAIVSYYAELKDRLFTRCYNSIPTLILNQSTIQAYLRTVKKLESRLADQLSVVIACYFSFLCSEKIGQCDIDNIINIHGLLSGSYIEANTVSDCDDCWDELMQVQIDREGRTVRHCVDSSIEAYGRDLGTHGIRYYRMTKELFIANKSSALSKKLTKYPDYKSILKRDSKRFIRLDKQAVESLGNVNGIRLKYMD